VQGADLAKMADKAAPRVTITHHPDVRRMLMMQKAYAEGMRALVLYAASLQDALQIQTAGGGADQDTVALNDLLLPVVKGAGSERAYEMLTLSLQTFGGSGFLQDYPIEQYIRDAKIDSLYEGTTAIQGLDLFFRKILRNEGKALRALLAQITTFAAGEEGNGRLKPERTALARAAGDVDGLNTTRLLMALGDLVIGWLLARQAEVALAALDGDRADRLSAADRAFYQGKLATARFFAQTVLPRLAVEREIAEATTLDLMELPEEAF
jgi:hypothetical protein